MRSVLVAAALSLALVRQAGADQLAEFLFWNEIGDAVGLAAQSYADYVRERRLWRDNIAAAKADLARCGGCASAQAELDKWQGIESRFQEIVGSAFVSVGMPPIVAKALGITLPPAPTRSPAERARECQIVRPDWVAQRSEFCQSKVDAYHDCLRAFERQHGVCTADTAKVPGGQCWEESKFYQPCHDEDYQAVEWERKAQEARAAGAIIPDYIRHGTFAIVVYGRVPDDFLPRLPPAEVVRAVLGEEHVQEVKFRMRKEQVGALRQITVKHFHWSDVAPQSTCYDMNSPTDEIGLRVCEDLSEMSIDHHPPLLTCDYVGQRQGLLADAMYWYGTRPTAPVADPANLLRRARRHPLLAVGEPRTDCPATLEEAKEIDACYRSMLAHLGVQQVPPTIALRSEREKQRQAEYEARMRQIDEVRAALADFPLVGTYEFETTLDWGTFSGRCTIVRRYESRYSVACLDDDGNNLTARSHVSGGYFYLKWSSPDLTKYPPASLAYNVDLAYGESGHGDALVGEQVHGSGRGRLVRTGDLTRIAEFPIEGIYHLELSADGVGTSARCTITRDEQYLPPRFPIICTTEDGTVFESQGIPESRHARSLRFRSWYPGWMEVNGRDVTNLYFLVDPAYEQDDLATAALIGYADRNVGGRLVRTGNHTAALADPGAPDVRSFEPAAPPLSAAAVGLTGQWTGFYTCANLRIALELTLQDLGDGSLWGTFAFAASRESPTVPSGSFYLWGVKYPRSRQVELIAGPWIDRPPGWSTVNLAGRYALGAQPGAAPSTGELKGRILFRGCDEFAVRRVDESVAALGKIPEVIQAKLETR